MHIPTFNELLSYHLMETAFRKVQANKGAAGTDGITIDAYAQTVELGLHVLLSEISETQFRSAALLKVTMRQPNKKPRNLAIPTVKDRILHTALMLLLQPFFESEFEKCSYGYRPNRSYKMAVEKIAQLRSQGYTWVVDADIAQFFEQIPHAAIRELLVHYQLDEQLINLINECLFSRQVEHGELQFGAAVGLGIPQGSSLSPMIANLYLDSLDEALLNKQYNMVRYADDFVMLARSKAEAEQTLELTEILLTQLNLSLNKEKTHICSFTDGFEFLGHSFIDDLVLDNKSQTPVEATSKEQHEITQILEQIEEIDVEDIEQPKSPEIDSNAPLSRIVFDSEQWALVGKEIAQDTKIQLPPKLKTLYVTTQGAVLSKNALRIHVKKGQHLLSAIPMGTLDGIILFGRVHITNDVMSHCLQHSISIVLANQSGSFKGIIDNYGAYSETLLRQQVHHTGSEPRQLRIAKHILKGKFNNSLVVIKRALRKRKIPESAEATQHFSDAVKRFTHKLMRENSPNAILGIEGQVAKQYFTLYQSLFAEQWQFTQRNRQPPKDPINVLLSLGYSVLFNNIHTLVRFHKINPTLGYLHHGATDQPSLVLDLMEEFRAPIVDATVYKLINRGSLTLHDFETINNTCHIKKEGFGLFLRALEDKFNRQLIHPASQELTDYRRIIDRQIRLLKQSITDDSEHYEAFRIR